MQSSILVGGQAVIEGVMMRVPGAYATSVIDKNGEIRTQVEPFQPIIERKPKFNIPIIRGALGLYEAMKIGFRTLQWSSDIAYEEESKSWDDAVIEGWIAPHIIGWFEDTHYPSDQLVPFNGYWFHSSRDLTVQVRPHLPLDGSARVEDNMWTLNLSATSIDGIAGGDFIQMGLKEDGNNTFVYGEDEYDHPNPGIESFVDLYFDKSDWLGLVDNHGIMVESPYFSHDVRSSLDEVQAWNITGNLHNVSGDIELSWTMDEIDSDINLLIAGEIFNMKEISSVIVSSLDDIAVVTGDLSLYLAPSDFALSAAYPNPFNPSTTMDLSLNESGHVSIHVYNVLGQVVSTLIDGYMDAGYHTLTWNAKDVPSGMYLVKVQAGNNVETQKLMLLK